MFDFTDSVFFILNREYVILYDAFINSIFLLTVGHLLAVK